MPIITRAITFPTAAYLGGIEEAPTTGQAYNRQNGAWAAANVSNVAGPPGDGSLSTLITSVNVTNNTNTTLLSAFLANSSYSVESYSSNTGASLARYSFSTNGTNVIISAGFTLVYGANIADTYDRPQVDYAGVGIVSNNVTMNQVQGSMQVVRTVARRGATA